MKTLYVRATADNADDMVVVVELTPETAARLSNAEAAYEAASSTLRALKPEVKPYAVDVWFRAPVFDADDVVLSDLDGATSNWEDSPYDLSDIGLSMDPAAKEASVDYVILSARESGFTFRLVLHHATAEYSTEEVPWDFTADAAC